jgi:hypothetical protein
MRLGVGGLIATKFLQKINHQQHLLCAEFVILRRLRVLVCVEGCGCGRERKITWNVALLGQATLILLSLGALTVTFGLVPYVLPCILR